MEIRTSTEVEQEEIHKLLLASFDESEREEVAELVSNLLHDPSAEPRLSLLAADETGEVVGYVLFTAVQLVGTPQQVSASILAPLAVHPEHQSQGSGGRLVREGLERLHRAGVQLVFVLGYPDYYQRFGFQPAGRLGLMAPYPIADANADAWMVLALNGEIPGGVKGRVQCADSLNRPELWRE